MVFMVFVMVKVYTHTHTHTHTHVVDPYHLLKILSFPCWINLAPLWKRVKHINMGLFLNSVVFHWSVCLSLLQYHTVLITVLLWWVLQSGSVSPLTLFVFHLQNYFCYSMYFVFTYTFYNQFFSFYKVYWDFDWDRESWRTAWKKSATWSYWYLSPLI